MEPPGATAEWRLSATPPTTNLEPVNPTRKHPGCTWPPEQANLQRSQMVAAWRGDGDLARARQMHEPHVGGVPRSVLARLLAMPSESAPGTPIHSPRRRCSAASAAVAAMVHSPRAFASSDRRPLEKKGRTAQTLPYQCRSPTPEFGSYGSSCNSRCGSPVPSNTFLDYPIPSDEDDEGEDDVATLRQQVALLIKSLEDEKKRRASEQHLMQTVSPGPRWSCALARFAPDVRVRVVENHRVAGADPWRRARGRRRHERQRHREDAVVDADGSWVSAGERAPGEQPSETLVRTARRGRRRGLRVLEEAGRQERRSGGQAAAHAAPSADARRRHRQPTRGTVSRCICLTTRLAVHSPLRLSAEPFEPNWKARRGATASGRSSSRSRRRSKSPLSSRSTPSPPRGWRSRLQPVWRRWRGCRPRSRSSWRVCRRSKSA